MVLPVPVGGSPLGATGGLGPPPPELAGRFQILKVCLFVMMVSAIGQFTAGLMLGTLSQDALFLSFNVVVGIFLLNDDEHVKPFYKALMNTCFQSCAEHCRGGMSCLGSFVFLNVTSFILGILFNTSTAIFYLIVVMNGGTKGLGVKHGLMAQHHPHDDDTLLTPDGASNVTTLSDANHTAGDHLKSMPASVEHLSFVTSVALTIYAVCMLLAFVTQGVCAIQGGRAILDIGALAASQQVPTWSDDDPSMHPHGGLDRGSLARMNLLLGRYGGGGGLAGANRGGAGGAGQRLAGDGDSGPPGREPGPGGPAGHANAPPSAGPTQGNRGGFQHFQGTGHRLGS
eukprot:TRINITY_DN122031_c0_g1_i1.p1 TRINITY_DN122031_c0_g1~~TRINITY_DN122031_c0_g1_i1.p1  ORF type:complete len:342 (-),score=36.85 TRINITY_DN122031_c0_g1_i1:164-1189(-)